VVGPREGSKFGERKREGEGEESKVLGLGFLVFFFLIIFK
jgi:hypothetical protein